jgi:hypothetical protein
MLVVDPKQVPVTERFRAAGSANLAAADLDSLGATRLVHMQTGPTAVRA